MKNFIAISFITALLCWSSSFALAQENQTTSTAISTENQAVATSTQQTEITIESFEINNPGILPTSPFYFIKNWGREVKRLFISDPIKKAELELQIVNQQAAEIKKMEKIIPEKVKAIGKALENYQANIERLQKHLESIKETGQNPNIDELLDKLIDHSLKHQQLFEQLKTKFENKAEIKNRLEAINNKLDELMGKIPEKFESREKIKALENSIKEKIKEKTE